MRCYVPGTSQAAGQLHEHRGRYGHAEDDICIITAQRCANDKNGTPLTVDPRSLCRRKSIYLERYQSEVKH
jgi:hypothetical protein